MVVEISPPVKLPEKEEKKEKKAYKKPELKRYGSLRHVKGQFPSPPF